MRGLGASRAETQGGIEHLLGARFIPFLFHKWGNDPPKTTQLQVAKIGLELGLV